MRSVAILALVLCAAIYVKADGFAVCTFQNSDTVTGYIEFQQAAVFEDVTIVTNFTVSEAANDLSLVIFTLGDLGSDEAPTCWKSPTWGTWSSNDAASFIETSTVNGFQLFDAHSIIGRMMALVPGVSTCEEAISVTPAARCVVGNRNIAYAGTNYAGQYLPASEITSAYAKFVGNADYADLTGEAFFVPTSNGEVYVKVYVSGLVADSTHAVHLHTYGDITLVNGLSAGGHLNPYNKNHGLPPSLERHMGDLGNATANAEGIIEFGVVFNLLSFTYTGGNIIGRGLIIHTLGDDGNPLNTTASTGSAGGRIARAVIGLSNRVPIGYADVTSPAEGSLGTAGGLGYIIDETAAATTETTEETTEALAVAPTPLVQKKKAAAKKRLQNQLSTL